MEGEKKTKKRSYLGSVDEDGIRLTRFFEYVIDDLQGSTDSRSVHLARRKGILITSRQTWMTSRRAVRHEASMIFKIG